MLDKLFGSKARLKILKLFVLHPEEKYYIRQLSRVLKLQLNSVRRELENLEKFGLLTSQVGREENLPKPKAKGKNRNKRAKKYFQVNNDFILFDEIKALVVKAQILYERSFINKLYKLGNPKLVVFTGFFVNNPFSPADLLIVGRFNKAKLIKLIKELENDIGKEISYTIFNSAEFKYRRDITDVFLFDILEGRKLVAIDEVGLS
jgi:hypothetical protein